MKWIRKYPIGAAFVAVGVLGVIGFLFSSVGTTGSTTTVGATSETVASPAPTESTTDRPEVPPVDCGPLITLEEVDDALGVTGQLADIFQFAGGEACSEVLADNEDFFVQIQPGDPGDFEPGAQLIGVSGEPVSGVGDEAIWFGGEVAEGGGYVGALSVRQVTPLGALHYRILLGRPDLDSAAQLEIAKILATAALPRFPGVEVEQPEPSLMTIEREPADLSDVSFADNLLAREQAGDWTRGEGLVATLSFMAGEVEAFQVLLNLELADFSGTDVVRLAREYLESGPDPGAQAEISRLLDLLVVTSEGLEAVTATNPTPLVVSLQPVSLGVTAQESDDCQEWFGLACWGTGSDPDLDEMFGEGKYRLFHPAVGPGENVAGWTLDHIFWALEAMRDSAIQYEELGEMPTVDILFTPYTNSFGQTDVEDVDVVCFVDLNTPLQGLSKGHFQQWIAAEMAHCFIAKDFAEQLSVGIEVARWWENGLAIYLSGVVYPGANFEWFELPAVLEAHELETTVLDRSQTNWLFFEHHHRSGGAQGNLGLIEFLPTSGGRQEQGAKLSSYPGIEDEWHGYAEGLTNSDILDLGGSDVPYSPEAWEIEISGPTVVLDELRPFGVTRLHTVVAAGKFACVEYNPIGDLKTSWRSGKPGGSGGWSEPPDVLSGESVFVVTSTKPGANFTMEVKDVSDDSECEEEEQADDPADCQPDICDPSSYYWPLRGIN